MIARMDLHVQFMMIVQATSATQAFASTILAATDSLTVLRAISTAAAPVRTSARLASRAHLMQIAKKKLCARMASAVQKQTRMKTAFLTRAITVLAHHLVSLLMSSVAVQASVILAVTRLMMPGAYATLAMSFAKVKAQLMLTLTATIVRT